MAQISIRVDPLIKERAQMVCEEIGLSLSSAINIYLKKLTMERRVPFDLSADSFYSDAYMDKLGQAFAKQRAQKEREREEREQEVHDQEYL